MATPMQTGMASSATAPVMPPARPGSPRIPDRKTVSGTQTRAVADPASSHFSCSRRVPDERR